MRKRILRMWMKRKVAMRMMVRIINIGRICGRVIRLWGNERSQREIPPLSPLTEITLP